MSRLEFICAALTFRLSESLIVFNYWCGGKALAGKQKANSKTQRASSSTFKYIPGRCLGHLWRFRQWNVLPQSSNTKFESFASFHPLLHWRRRLSLQWSGAQWRCANYPHNSTQPFSHFKRPCICESRSELRKYFTLGQNVCLKRTHALAHQESAALKVREMRDASDVIAAMLCDS